MNFFAFVCLLSVLFALLCMAVMVYCFCVCFYVPDKRRVSAEQCYEKHLKHNDTEICSLMNCLMNAKSERVSITSHDGLKLCGYYYHVSDTAPLEIGFHGYRSSYARDFCGGADICLKNGINLLLVDQRAHGNSEGNTISFGINERLDCKAWVQYASKRFKNTKIILSGVSMGASTVLMASDLDLPGNVCCIVADCPYSVPSDIIKRVCKQRGLSTRIFYPFIKLSAKLFGGFDLEQSSPAESVKNTEIPILLIHGTNDDFVPPDMSKDIFDACKSQKQILFVPGAGHAMSYIVSPYEYTKTVLEFISRYAK